MSRILQHGRSCAERLEHDYSQPSSVRAIVRDTYGSPDVRKLQESTKPDVTDDRCATVQQRRRFAKLLFSRVTVDGNYRLRGWALNNPFSSFSNSPSPVQNLF